MNSGVLVLLGLVVASVAAAAMPALLGLVTGVPLSSLVVLTFKVSLLYSGIASVLLGLPAFAALRHGGYANGWSASAGGGVIGLLVSIAFYSGINVQAALLFALYGATAGASFWVTLRLGEWCLAKSEKWERHG